MLFGLLRFENNDFKIVPATLFKTHVSVLEGTVHGRTKMF